MAQPAGAVADPVQKIEDFIAAMTAVSERLASRADLRIAEATMEALAEMEQNVACFMGVAGPQTARQASADGRLTSQAHKQVEQAERTAQLVERHRVASQETLPAAARHLKDQVVAAITSNLAEAAQQVADRAEEIDRGLDDLGDALVEHERSLAARMSELSAAFASLGDAAGASGATTESALEALLAVCADLNAQDQAAMMRLMSIVMSFLEAQLGIDIELKARLEGTGKQVVEAAHEMLAEMAPVLAAVVVVVAAIVVAVAAFGAGGPLLVAVIAAAAVTVSNGEVVLEAVDRLLQVAIPGLDLSHAVAPFLPELEPVTALVGAVGKVLDAMNPFN